MYIKLYYILDFVVGIYIMYMYIKLMYVGLSHTYFLYVGLLYIRLWPVHLYYQSVCDTILNEQTIGENSAYLDFVPQDISCSYNRYVYV